MFTKKYLKWIQEVQTGNVVFFYCRLKPDPKIIFVSPSVKEFLGYDQKEFTKKFNNCSQFINPTQKEFFKNQIKLIHSGEKEHISIKKLIITGKEDKKEVNCYLVRIKDGIFGFLTETITSIEKSKIAEELSKLAPIGIFLFLNKKLVFTNKMLSEILGAPHTQISNLSVKEMLKLTFHKDRKKLLKTIKQSLQNSKPISTEVKFMDMKGKIKWVRLTLKGVKIKNQAGILGIIEDITIKEKLRVAYSLLSSINRVILKTKNKNELFDEVVRVFVEKGKFQIAKIFEVKNSYTVKLISSYKEKVSGKNIEKLIAKFIYENNLIDEIFYVSIPIIIKNKVKYFIELFSNSPHMLSQEEISVFEEISSDISFALEYIEKEKDLYRKRFYDELTGVGNRNLLYNHLDEFITAGIPFYLLIIDLYNFKNINEKYGEKLADLLLVEIANNLKSSITKRTYRFGSDEFALILKKDELFDALESIKTIFEIPFFIEDRVIPLNYNIGVVNFPKDGKYRMELILRAERTLQSAKEEGKDVIKFFDPAEYRNIRKFLDVEEILERAIEKNSFLVHLQPIVKIENNQVVGAESLIRLKDPEGNFIPPSLFIPVAEKTNQITHIDTIMIKKCSKLIREWIKKGYNPVSISINITPSNIKMIYSSLRKKKLKDFVSFEFGERDLRIIKEFFIFELTEREFVEIAERKKELEELRKQGFRIAIDDFGTGYSTLSYLAETQLDYLKIDMYFIKNMTKNEKIYKLVKSIINIAKIFGIKTIAEGVETEEEYNTLKKLGCDLYQGYYFSPPIPPDQFEKFLKK